MTIKDRILELKMFGNLEVDSYFNEKKTFYCYNLDDTKQRYSSSNRTQYELLLYIQHGDDKNSKTIQKEFPDEFI